MVAMLAVYQAPIATDRGSPGGAGVGDEVRWNTGRVTISPAAQRRLLLALGAALLVTSVAYLVVRSSSDGGDAVATADTALDTTTTRPPTTTTPSTSATTTTRPLASVAPSDPLPSSTSTAAASVPATTTSTDPAPTTEPAPPFESSMHPVTAEELGASWTPGRGCTPPEELRRLHLRHWGYDGAVHEGDLIVEAAQAERIVQVFGEIYAARFPIERMVPVAAYDGDDGASMRDNNTSGYNCRTVAGSGSLSQHAYGRAIDINPLHNPYVKGGTVDPPEGAAWADRDRDDPGMIRAGDAVVRAFERAGWSWGGYWKSGPDYQHFSATGR
jgi:hypothetical protein